MKVIECLKKANKLNVITAYEKIFPYEEYDWLRSRNLKNIFNRNTYLSFVFDDIINKYNVLYDDIMFNPKNLIFVIELESENIEDKSTNFYFANLNIETLKKPFSIEDLDNKCYSFSTNERKNEELLNYKIAKTSIEKYGIDICACVILFNLISFGYTKHDIERIEKDISNSIEKGRKDIENGNFITQEEMEMHLNSWREEIYKEANVYEKSLLEAEDLKEDYLKDISKKFRKEKSKKNKDIIIDFIEQELNIVNTNNEKRNDMNNVFNIICDKFNNIEYDDLYKTISANLKFLKDNNIVIAYGMSDDLLEFEGAFVEEYSAFYGTKIYVDLDKKCFQQKEEITNFDNIVDFPYFINALWCKNDIPWTIETNIPHKKFNIIDDGEIFSKGIIFLLKNDF